MLLRIDVVMAAGEHRDRAGGEAGAMRRRIDAAREAGRDDEAGLAEFAREPLGEFQARAPTHCASRPCAIIGRASAARLPRTAISGGASSIAASRSG